MFTWPRKSRSTSGFTGPQGYWWLGLMNFRNFFIPYVFEVMDSISCSFTKLICSSDLENPGQLPVSEVLKSTDDRVLWIFEISSFSTFSRSRSPFFCSFTRLLCSGNLENTDQFPVLQVLEGTGDWVLVPSSTGKNGSWPGFSKSSKQGSSVKLWKMDSLTPKT